MSNDSQTTIQQHADRLRQLGFPEKVIEEVVQAYSRGLFDMKPSPDLIARVIDQYRKSRMTESNGQHTGGSIA